MDKVDSVQQVAPSVLAHIRRAAHAVKRHDMNGMIEDLGAALMLYELHPSQAHQPASHMRDLLACIRAGRSLCASLGQPERALAALESQAELLLRPIH
jgi:hypothetical protein